MSSFKELSTLLDTLGDQLGLDQTVGEQAGGPKPTRLLPNLRLRPVESSIRPELQALSCSEDLITLLNRHLEIAYSRLIRAAEEAFARTTESLSAIYPQAEDMAFQRNSEMVGRAIAIKFERDAASLRQSVLDEVQEAKGRLPPLNPLMPTSILHPLPSPPPEPVGEFTVEVVSILQKAFETSETLSRAEVKGLMQVTGLNNKQFANARQRRGRKAAPYEVPRHPTRRRPQAGPVRNVSDSSSSSFSSFESCASTSNDPVPVRLEPELSPVDSTTHQAQLWSSEGEDSSMDLSSTEDALPLFTSPLSLPVCMVTVPQSDPIPRAPTTAETDQFFASQQTLPPSSPVQNSPTNRSSHWFQRDWDPVESTESELSSMLDQVPSTHSFLDDQFFKNVFGTLGVTQGGGLTLTMDSFSDDEFASQDPTGGTMNFASTIGGGIETAGMSFGW